MIQVNNLSKHFGAQVLFEGVQFQLGKNEKVGLVGRNGAGKTTLFKLITGELTPDSGEIIFPKNYKWGTLKQHLVFTQKNVLLECTQVLNPEEYSDHEAEKILMGLGFSEEDFQKPCESFSGGYQIRINLAKVLLSKPDMLLLDEPTNYLDIVSMRWLKDFLKRFTGEIIIITHDRDFMDEVVTHTMGLHRKMLKKVKGPTYKFYEKILEEEEIYEKTRENLEKKKKDLEAFVERFKAKASKAGQAQSRMKMLSKMDQMDQLDRVKNLGFSFRYKDIEAKQLARFENLSFRYREDTPILFNQVTFDVNKGDCIAIIGKNGKGKSTLLNVIGEFLTPLAGSFYFHPKVQKGFFGQTNISRLQNEATIEEEIRTENGDLSHTEIRSICGAMMFDSDLALKKIKVLSGGEKARVMLGKILARPSNLLLLDEPTNHLDMESIETLTEEIEQFPGASIIVTHSEMMLHRLATKLVVFRKNGAEFFHGTYAEFLEKIGFEDEEDKITLKANSKDGAIDKKKLRIELESLKNEKALKLRRNREEMEKIEAIIVEKEELYKKIELKLNELSMVESSQQNNSHHEAVQNFSHAIGKLQKQMDESFEELEKLSAESGAIEEFYQQKIKQSEDLLC